MKHMQRIRYISYGPNKTGGYLHEYFWCQALKDKLLQAGNEVVIEVKRDKQYTQNFWQRLLFIIRPFQLANADWNIVVAQTALTAIIRNLFSNRKIIIVWHSHDEAYIKGFFLKFYFKLLFFLLRFIRTKRVSIACDSIYWSNKLKEYTHSNINYLFWPNLFDTSYYSRFRTQNKKKQIYLGQFHPKNDPMIFDLAEQLTQKGYDCFFSTLKANEEVVKDTYQIKYFKDFEQYLNEVACSLYALALSKQKEGWNRIAHESILLHTPVIAYNSGGLGELLKESNSKIVTNIDECLQLILSNYTIEYNIAFEEKYDIKNVELFLRQFN